MFGYLRPLGVQARRVDRLIRLAVLRHSVGLPGDSVVRLMRFRWMRIVMYYLFVGIGQQTQEEQHRTYDSGSSHEFTLLAGQFGRWDRRL
jgi:hypothetical protein